MDVNFLGTMRQMAQQGATPAKVGSALTAQFADVLAFAMAGQDGAKAQVLPAELAASPELAQALEAFRSDAENTLTSLFPDGRVKPGPVLDGWSQEMVARLGAMLDRLSGADQGAGAGLGTHGATGETKTILEWVLSRNDNGGAAPVITARVPGADDPSDLALGPDAGNGAAIGTGNGTGNGTGLGRQNTAAAGVEKPAAQGAVAPAIVPSPAEPAMASATVASPSANTGLVATAAGHSSAPTNSPATPHGGDGAARVAVPNAQLSTFSNATVAAAQPGAAARSAANPATDQILQPGRPAYAPTRPAAYTVAAGTGQRAVVTAAQTLGQPNITQGQVATPPAAAAAPEQGAVQTGQPNTQPNGQALGLTAGGIAGQPNVAGQGGTTVAPNGPVTSQGQVFASPGTIPGAGPVVVSTPNGPATTPANPAVAAQVGVTSNAAQSAVKASGTAPDGAAAARATTATANAQGPVVTPAGAQNSAMPQAALNSGQPGKIPAAAYASTQMQSQGQAQGQAQAQANGPSVAAPSAQAQGIAPLVERPGQPDQTRAAGQRIVANGSLAAETLPQQPRPGQPGISPDLTPGGSDLRPSAAAGPGAVQAGPLAGQSSGQNSPAQTNPVTQIIAGQPNGTMSATASVVPDIATAQVAQGQSVVAPLNPNGTGPTRGAVTTENRLSPRALVRQAISHLAKSDANTPAEAGSAAETGQAAVTQAGLPADLRMVLVNALARDPQELSQIVGEAPAFGATAPAGSIAVVPRVAQALPRQAGQSRTPSFARNIAAQIQGVNFSQGTTRVELMPKGLGGIEIEIAKDDSGKLQVMVRAENSAVLTAMRSDREVLVTMLRDSGTAVDESSISFESARDGQGRAAQGGGSQAQSQPNRAQQDQPEIADDQNVTDGDDDQPYVDDGRLNILT